MTDGKNGTVDSVRRTCKLCCYSNTLNRGHAVFACHESTLAVHSKNIFMVSNLTTGNSRQQKISPKFRPSQKRRFWIGGYNTDNSYQHTSTHFGFCIHISIVFQQNLTRARVTIASCFMKSSMPNLQVNANSRYIQFVKWNFTLP